MFSCYQSASAFLMQQLHAREMSNGYLMRDIQILHYSCRNFHSRYAANQTWTNCQWQWANVPMERYQLALHTHRLLIDCSKLFQWVLSHCMKEPFIYLFVFVFIACIIVSVCAATYSQCSMLNVQMLSTEVYTHIHIYSDTYSYIIRALQFIEQLKTSSKGLFAHFISSLHSHYLYKTHFIVL